LTGFINTDGSFFFSLTRDVVAKISIGQHTKSIKLLNAIINFLGFGYLSKSKGNIKEITIAKFSYVTTLTKILKKYK
jgi:hypothetical protein